MINKKKYTPEELKGLVQTNIHFINSKKYNYSLKKLLDTDSIKKIVENPSSGLPNGIIGKLLGMTPEEVQSVYDSAIFKLKEYWGIEE